MNTRTRLLKKSFPGRACSTQIAAQFAVCMRSVIIMAFALLFAPYLASAAEGAVAIQDTPAKAVERSTPVTIEFDGTDSIGSRLAMRLKETFNASNLFELSEDDVPKIRVLLATKPEFESRPGVGSAYSVIWLFSQSETTLRHFLVSELGLLTPDQVDNVAATIIEKTDGLAVRYRYLFQ